MKARRIFYEGLSSMLTAGIPIRGALDHAVAGASGDFAQTLRHLQAEVARGRPLADAMAERPGAFPRFHVELVRAAEGSGILDRSLRALAETEAAAERTFGRVAARVAYPLFVVHFAAIPLNIGLLIGGHLGRFATGCLAFWVPLWILLGAGWLVVRRARTGGGAARFLLGIPWLGGILRDGAHVRWARVFAAMEDAGVAPDVCTERAAAVTGYSVLEEALAAPAIRIRQGASRADAFASAGLPTDFYQALAQGELSGTIAEGLGQAADAREQSASSRSEVLLNLLPAVATILVGIVVLVVAMKVIGPMYRIPR